MRKSAAREGDDRRELVGVRRPRSVEDGAGEADMVVRV
jgi:hypothetical protein